MFSIGTIKKMNDKATRKPLRKRRSAKPTRDQISAFAKGESLISDERCRHRQKGFFSAHDDKLTDASLLRAAMDILVGVAADENGEVPDAPEWVMERVEHVARKYRNAPIRQLVIAASLLVAEIERRERAELAKPRRRPITPKANRVQTSDNSRAK